MEREPSEWDKKRQLYLRQKALLDIFLGNGAITRAQYDKSLGDLTVKMGMTETEDNNAPPETKEDD